MLPHIPSGVTRERPRLEWRCFHLVGGKGCPQGVHMIALFHAILDYLGHTSRCWESLKKSPAAIDDFAMTRNLLGVGPRRLELLTSCVSSKRSTRLS